MKVPLYVLLILLISWGAGAFSSQEYALEVAQKDGPRALQWLTRLSAASQLSPVELFDLYRSALPESQDNQQLGISIKGSLERTILFLEGAAYLPRVQDAPEEFQHKKQRVLETLQTAKDGLDRFEFGEDPQILWESWQGGAGLNFTQFTSECPEVLGEIQRRLAEPPPAPEEKAAPAEGEVAAPTPSFEEQRFEAYTESALAGQVAEECQGAALWRTDLAPSCSSDESLDCDRRYARECKRLQ